MCQNNTCPVHVREDSRVEVGNSFGVGHAITYIDDVVIASMDNPAFRDPATALIALLGGPEAALPGMFMTVVAKVGDKAVGDLTDEELSDALMHQEEFVFMSDDYDPDSTTFPQDMTKILFDKHDETVLGYNAGLFS